MSRTRTTPSGQRARSLFYARRDFWAALTMFGFVIIVGSLSLRWHSLYPGFAIGVIATIVVYSIAGRIK